MRIRLLSAGAALAMLLPACADLSAQVSRPIRLCLAGDNLPMSAAYPPSGIEVELARALATALSTEAELRWLDHHDRAEDAVLGSRCEAAFGAVVDPGLADSRLVPGLALTVPYHATGYSLIRRSDARPVRSLTELGDARIGVEVESVPIYTLKQRGHKVYALDDYDAVIKAVKDGRVQYGYLWGPLAAWILREREDVVLVREFEPEERWDFALVVREEEAELRELLNGAIHALMKDGKIGEIFSRYGVPYLRPEMNPGPAGPVGDTTDGAVRRRSSS